MNVKRDRLRGKDKVKYQIYDAIKTALPRCNNRSDLCDRLAKQGIGAYEKLTETVGTDSTLTIFREQVKAVRKESRNRNK